jgi:hypothetical protein
MVASDNPYPYGSDQAIIFDLVTEDWPGAATAARQNAVEYAFSLKSDEYYTNAMVALNHYIYGD